MIAAIFVVAIPLRVSGAAFVPPPLHVARHEGLAAIVAIDDGDGLAAQCCGLDDVEVASARVLLDQHGFAVGRVGLEPLQPR